tara:strand:- start:1 stop:339 length:339 start_codon:yes stop_codon:yes gene_type:complete
MHKEKKEIEIIESSPVVMLCINSSKGEVLYLSQVGGDSLVTSLRELSKLPDYPIHLQEFQLDDIGQEIYFTRDKAYFNSITGIFTSMAWSTSRGLATMLNRSDIVFSLVVTY